MYLNRNKNGYGWYAQIRSKEGESENIAYINFAFKKGCEPLLTELTEYGSYSGELIFRDSTGAERKVFPLAKEWNGRKNVEFRLLEKTNEYHDPEPTWQPKTEAKWEIKRNEIPTQIEDEDIPFL